jgi:hypothetical protein
MSKDCLGLIGVFSLMAVLCSCTPGQKPFLIVQICLGDEQSLASFIAIVESISQLENMNVIDGSAKAKTDLEQLRALHQPDPIIQINVVGKNGVAMGIDNIGLPGYQLALGFSEGSDPAAAHMFATKVIDSVKYNWPVVYVPSGQGALPLKTCGNQTNDQKRNAVITTPRN